MGELKHFKGVEIEISGPPELVQAVKDILDMGVGLYMDRFPSKEDEEQSSEVLTLIG